MKIKRFAICLSISLSVAALLTFFESHPFYHLLELKLYDLRMNLRTPPRQDPRILFVEMDDEAIANLGRWPWPRNIFANMLNTLESLGARQIVFDVTFAQPTNPIIKREEIDNIIDEENKKIFNLEIKNRIGESKSLETLPQEEYASTLTEVLAFFNGYADLAEQRLAMAVVDNDLVLAESFKNSHSFIGYSFEVLSEEVDIRKQELLPQIKQDILDRVRNNPQAHLEDLPPSIRENPFFDDAELRGVVLRSKILLLLDKNIEISLNEVSQMLNADAEQIRSHFNLTRNQLIKDKILSLLKDNPKAKLVDAVNKNQIFDKNTQKSFKEAWPEAKNEAEALRKFSFPLPESQDFFTSIKIEPPFHQFTGVVHGGGFLNGIPDTDGILRTVPLFVEYKGNIFPHIAMAIIWDLYKPQGITFEPEKYCILRNANVDGHLKDLRIPIDKNGAILINWAGKWKDSFDRVSIAEIYRLDYLRNLPANNPSGSSESSDRMNQLKDKEEKLSKKVKDKICIVGLTAAGTHDYNPTPYEAIAPMVGTHGNVINAILTEQFITRLPSSYNLLILLALSMLTGLGLPLLSSMKGLLFTSVILVITFLGSLWLFDQGTWSNLASPVLLSFFSYLGITSYKFATEEKAKREIKNAFSKYVSPEVIEDIMKDPSKLQLGGERKILSVQFSDIRSFTTYCEKRKPEEIVTILNEYLDAMTRIIVAHKGTLDKYVGDEIMAIWGAPRHEPPEINAKRAVIASVKMLERLRELQKEWKERGLEPLDIGIGVNTGEMIVGNMGSELRMDYTVIGDAVNLGARVEALTRDYKTYFIISEFTFEYVKDIIEYEPLEEIKVKGKNIPVMIYNVLGLKSDNIQI